MMKSILTISLILFQIVLFGQMSEKEVWVNDKYDQMSTDEKIGQLYMIRAFSKNDPGHIKFVKTQIKKYSVGGICFFQGDPMRQADLVNEYQGLSKTPMMISMDAEWGIGMRFPKKAISFPKQMTLGAINDHQLIYRMGKEVGRQCRLAGMQLNYAPVVDVNNNPDNPVINYRSFGEDRYNVAAKSYAYMKGLQDANVLSCAKHFPGHGDTNVDSHHDLPVIPHSRRRLDSLELFTFDMMIKQGVDAIMVAHLQVPALDATPNLPTTVSKKVVTDLLQEEMNFKGLIFTDGMEMKGVTKHFPVGEADLQAFLAGNDIILLPDDIDVSFKLFKKAVADGRITEERLARSVKKILSSKYDLDLHRTKGLAQKTALKESLFSTEAKVVKSKIYEKAITLAANTQYTLPIFQFSGIKFGSVSLGTDKKTTFQSRLSEYIDLSEFQIRRNGTSDQYSRALESLQYHDIVFISVHEMSRNASKKYGLTQDQINFIHQLAGRTRVVLTLFGSPYTLEYFEQIPCTVVAYEGDPMAQEAAAQALMGAIDITGKLPITASEKFPIGTGQQLPALGRLGYSIPEAVGLNSDTLRRIDELAKELISKKAAPGCQILVAKDNKIVYHKSFGFHTYDKKRPVDIDDIYDVASVTKIMASTISTMKLQDMGQFDINDPIAKYIPEEDTTNKAGIIYEDMMAHVSGLASWIPFFKSTIDEENPREINPSYYATQKSSEFALSVTPKMYMRTDYQDSIWRRIFSSNLKDNRQYKYSDLAFYIMNKTIENISGEQVDQFAETNFYGPMGLKRTMFNPIRTIDKKYITPSEHDQYWRNEIVHGTVHDMGAAMLDGVSGHAGLFSNSKELSILLQMLLNGGYYGGQQYLNPSTIKYYTQRHWRSSRRGIGFDMKELNPDKSMNMSEKASRSTFGHLGFTGTAVFADPESNLVFVFLSNRTFPTMNNNKLGKENYRPKIQSVVYNALMPN